MAGKDMPIFSTFDLINWLLPVTNNFPRAYRHTVTERLLDAVFDLRERLEEANLHRRRGRKERLDRADEALALVRLYLQVLASLLVVLQRKLNTFFFHKHTQGVELLFGQH